jgi:hypothetical protein
MTTRAIIACASSPHDAVVAGRRRRLVPRRLPQAYLRDQKLAKNF